MSVAPGDPVLDLTPKEGGRNLFSCCLPKAMEFQEEQEEAPVSWNLPEDVVEERIEQEVESHDDNENHSSCSSPMTSNNGTYIEKPPSASPLAPPDKAKTTTTTTTTTTVTVVPNMFLHLLQMVLAFFFMKFDKPKAIEKQSSGANATTTGRKDLKENELSVTSNDTEDEFEVTDPAMSLDDVVPNMTAANM